MFLLEDNLPSLLSFAYLDQSQIVTDITGKGSPGSFFGGWGEGEEGHSSLLRNNFKDNFFILVQLLAVGVPHWESELEEFTENTL